MRNLIGALLGAAIDRRDGDRGVKGLVAGAALQGIARKSIPLGVAVVAGLALKRRWDRRRATHVAPDYPAEAVPDESRAA